MKNLVRYKCFDKIKQSYKIWRKLYLSYTYEIQNFFIKKYELNILKLHEQKLY